MTVAVDSEADLVARLRAGEEAAFTLLVDLHANVMLRIARRYVKDDATAEEVVQEAWLAVLQGVARFADRCSLKSWIFSILVKRAMTRGKRDARQIPFSGLAWEELERDDPSVAADRFQGAGRRVAAPLAR